MRRVAVLAAALSLAAGGCGGSVQSFTFPNPPTTPPTAPSPPTLPANLSSLGEAPVPGVTTTTVPRLAPGHAALNGTVFGPSGPVAGATVEADRFVGDQMTATQAKSAADGSWTIAKILGGRYRVRAWKAPNMDLTSPQIVFLGATQTLTMSLQLAGFKGPNLANSVSPEAPVTDEQSNLLIEVTNPTVGPDGVVRYLPQPNVQVTLVNGPNWQVANGNPATTNGNGDVLFEISCLQPGPSPLSATVGSSPPIPLQMPACSSPPAPPTTVLFNPCPTTTVPSHPRPRVPHTTSTTLNFGNC